MKIKFLSIIASAAMLSGLVACDNYTPVLPQQGEGKLNTESITVEVSNAENIINHQHGTVDRKSPASRATVDLSDFIVTVNDIATGKQVNQWRYADMPELPVFPVGKYTVTVTSDAESSQAEWEKPFFKGSQEFEIKANEVEDVEPIICKLANIKVTVKFTDELKAVAGDDLKVIIRTEGVNSMTFTAAETRAAYFPAVDGLITLSAAFSGTVYGNKEQFTKAIQDVEAGQHRIITYGLRTNPALPPEESGVIDMDGSSLNVSTEVVEEDLTVDMPYEDDLLDSSDRPGQEGPEPGTENPGGDDPVGPDDPAGDCITFTSSLGDLSQTYPVDGIGSQYNVDLTISAEHGIAHVFVTIVSPTLDVSEFDLDNSFDLAEPGSNVAGLDALQFPHDKDVIGKTQLYFDITQFAQMLGVFDGTHTFHITVEDQQGHSAKTQFILKTN